MKKVVILTMFCAMTVMCKAQAPIQKQKPGFILLNEFAKKTIKAHQQYIEYLKEINKNANQENQQYTVFLQTLMGSKDIDIMRISTHPDSLKITLDSIIYKLRPLKPTKP